MGAGWSAWSWYQEASSAGVMSQAAASFLESLKPEQRAVAVLPVEARERVDWHFIPKDKRKGLQVREMSAEQRRAAKEVLRAALSQLGYDKATKIMELEALLKELEKSRTGSPLRDPERYYFTIFGQPTAGGRWGLSVEGHHLSLNFLVDQGKVVSSTPTVFAANPAEVKSGLIASIPVGTRVLKDEEVLAFELVHALTEEQKASAIIAAKAPAEIRGAGEAQPPREAAAGIAAGSLTSEQRGILRRLIGAYTASVTPDVAEARWREIDQAGFEHVHFAWAGAEKPGIGHYYRVQGPTFLIEFVNTQPDSAGNPANHIHSVWRDMRGDFGVPIE
jgi:hypothetical protein